MIQKADKQVSTLIVNTDKKTGQSVPWYRVFFNDQGQKLVYYPVPKNANSSFKMLLIKYLGLEDDFAFYEDEAPMSDQAYYRNKPDDKQWLAHFFPAKRQFVRLNPELVEYRIAIVRDPIERFFSAYQNRILWHKDQEFAGLTVGEVIEQLELGNFANRHFLPQTYFLGADPSYFSHVSLMPDLGCVTSALNEFFGRKLSVPRIQIRKGSLEGLSKSAMTVARLRKLYAEDYQFIGELSSKKAI